MPSSWRRSGRRSANAGAASPASIPRTCPRRSCRARRPDRHRPRARRRRHLGLRQPGRRADLRHRPHARAVGGLAGVGARHDRRPPVRLLAAGHPLRGRRRGRRALRRRRGGRRRVDVAGAPGLGPARAAPRSATGYAERYGPGLPNQGLGAEHDRRALVASPAPSWTTSRSARTRRRPRRATRAASTRRSCRRDRRGTSSTPTRASGGAAPASRWRSCSPRSGPTAPSRRQRSQISDGAAAVLVCTSAKAARARPAADRAGAHVGRGRRDPNIDADRPDPRDAKDLARAGLTSTTSARSRSTRRSPRSRSLGARVRPAANGSTARRRHRARSSPRRQRRAAGHDAAAPHADNGIRYGLQVMCEGGGQANATLYESL